MNNINLSGVLETIFPAEIVTANFEKRVFYLQEQGVQYPNTWLLEMHQGDCNLLDGFKHGDIVVCSVDVRGRAWSKGERNGVINTLRCIGIKKTGTAQNTPPKPAQQQTYTQPQSTVQAKPQQAQSQGDFLDDAPF